MMFDGCQTNRKQVENKRYIIIFVGSRKGVTFAPSSILDETIQTQSNYANQRNEWRELLRNKHGAGKSEHCPWCNRHSWCVR